MNFMVTEGSLRSVERLSGLQDSDLVRNVGLERQHGLQQDCESELKFDCSLGADEGS